MRPRPFLAMFCIGAITLSQGLHEEEVQAKTGKKTDKSGWRLDFEENFEQAIGGETAPWKKVAPGKTDPFDDDGPYFHAIGGTDFVKHWSRSTPTAKHFGLGRRDG